MSGGDIPTWSVGTRIEHHAGTCGRSPVSTTVTAAEMHPTLPTRYPPPTDNEAKNALATTRRTRRQTKLFLTSLSFTAFGIYPP